MALNALIASSAQSALNFAGQYFGGLQQFKYQKALQEQAAQLNYDYGQKSLLNSPSSTRSGLEKAGYNPMLAVQNATSGANAGWTSAGSAKGADYTNVGTDIIANAQSFKRLENESHLADTQSSANEATARNQNADAANKEAQNPYISEKMRSEIGKMNAETANIERNTEYYEALEHNLEVMQRLQEMGINLDYNAKIYGADQAYNASTYKTNTEAETARGMRTDRLPFGFGSTYYDKRALDIIKERGFDPNDRKYWQGYGY